MGSPQVETSRRPCSSPPSPHHHSNTNAKKWETELQTLQESNARLEDALTESSANVESWKKQLSVCKEESDALRDKVGLSTPPRHCSPNPNPTVQLFGGHTAPWSVLTYR